MSLTLLGNLSDLSLYQGNDINDRPNSKSNVHGDLATDRIAAGQPAILCGNSDISIRLVGSIAALKLQRH